MLEGYGHSRDPDGSEAGHDGLSVCLGFPWLAMGFRNGCACAFASRWAGHPATVGPCEHTMDPTYTIDVDGELIPGRGYAASYMISDLDGSLVRRRQLARRFASYSDAMGCALDIAKATAASFHPTGGTIPTTTTPPVPATTPRGFGPPCPRPVAERSKAIRPDSTVRHDGAGLPGVRGRRRCCRRLDGGVAPDC